MVQLSTDSISQVATRVINHTDTPYILHNISRCKDCPYLIDIEPCCTPVLCPSAVLNGNADYALAYHFRQSGGLEARLALRAWFSLGALGSFDTRRTLKAFTSFFTLRTLWTLWSRGTLRACGTGRPLDASLTLRALAPRYALKAYEPLLALRPFGPGARNGDQGD